MIFIKLPKLHQLFFFKNSFFFFNCTVAPSVLYTVQRVITTSQIQSTEMIECSNNAAPNVHIATASNSTCSNTYQAQAQMMPQMNDSEQSASGNFYSTASASNGLQQETVSVNRTLQNVTYFATNPSFSIFTQFDSFRSIAGNTDVRLFNVPCCRSYGNRRNCSM